MGVLKNHRAYNANATFAQNPSFTGRSNSISDSSRGVYVGKFKTITGEEYDRLCIIYYDTLSVIYPDIELNTTKYLPKSTNNVSDAFIAVASSETLVDYDINDYEVKNQIGEITQSSSRNVMQDGGEIIHAIRIFNNSEDEYVPNTSMVWDSSKHYYYLLNDEYIEVLSEPENFTATYDEYYIYEEASSITVKSIKFIKKLRAVNKNWSSGYNNANKVYLNVLYCTYYLDEEEWITIPVGESRGIVIDFSNITI